MPVITSIEPQQGDAERVNVYLDGSFAFGASRMIVVARGLVPGQELSRDEVDALQHDDVIERAWGAALNFLSFRPRSRREVEDYFRKKKTEADIVEAVLERLIRLGLVDDAEFARYWVENRGTFRPRGTRALRVELRQKGLETEVIEGALEELEEDELAYQAGARKLRSFSRLDDREFFRKMVTYLQRRGFSYEQASTTTRRLATERGQSGSPADQDVFAEGESDE